MVCDMIGVMGVDTRAYLQGGYNREALNYERERSAHFRASWSEVQNRGGAVITACKYALL